VVIIVSTNLIKNNNNKKDDNVDKFQGNFVELMHIKKKGPCMYFSIYILLIES
jgi:hypothetical protein